MSSDILTAIANPELKDTLDRYKFETSKYINCVQIGTIESFDPTKNTATVSINFKRAIADGREVEYPPLTDCPVFVLNGGDAYLNMPITSGDTCLVLFNDRDIDNWWYSGDVVVPNSPRAHSLSDGIVLVGIQSLANPITLDATKVILNSGTKPVKITSTGTASTVSVTLDSQTGLVQIKNTAQSLYTLLNNLCTQLTTLCSAIEVLTVTCSGPGVASTVPVNAASFVTISGQISTIATNLAALLGA